MDKKNLLRESSDDAPAVGASPTTLDDINGLLYIDVFSSTKPSLAGLLDLSRAGAYAEVSRGTWPVVRSGTRIRVHVPSLLAAVKP